MTVPYGLIPHHGYDRSEHQHQQARGDTDTNGGECDGEHEHCCGTGEEYQVERVCVASERRTEG